MIDAPETDSEIPYIIRALIEDHEDVSRSREGFASLLFDTLIHNWGQYDLDRVMGVIPAHARPMIVELAADLKARNFHYAYIVYGSESISDEKLAAFQEKKKSFVTAVTTWARENPDM